MSDNTVNLPPHPTPVLYAVSSPEAFEVDIALAELHIEVVRRASPTSVMALSERLEPPPILIASDVLVGSQAILHHLAAHHHIAGTPQHAVLTMLSDDVPHLDLSGLISWADAHLLDGRDFLLGDHFSLADVRLFGLLYPWTLASLAIPTDLILGWMQRLEARASVRDAAQRHAELLATFCQRGIARAVAAREHMLKSS